MKRLVSSLIFLALAVWPARAQETNENRTTDFDSFRIIARNNIFDASRRGGISHVQRHVPVVDEVIFRGVALDNGSPVAFFDGNNSPLKPGDSIKRLKIVKITLDSTELTDSTNKYVLKEDGGRELRREDNGPWQLSEVPDSTAAPATNAGADSTLAPASTSSAAPLAGATETEIEKRLRLKREQDDK